MSIGSPEKMEPITKVSHIPSSRWALVCSLCNEKFGASIQVWPSPSGFFSFPVLQGAGWSLWGSGVCELWKLQVNSGSRMGVSHSYGEARTGSNLVWSYDVGRLCSV